ncbi:hypothetical protein [Staphylococcus phage PT1-4]
MYKLEDINRRYRIYVSLYMYANIKLYRDDVSRLGIIIPFIYTCSIWTWEGAYMLIQINSRLLYINV